MSQNWFRPHPLGIYPRGNAKCLEELSMPRFGTLSPLQFVAKGQVLKRCISRSEPTEDAFLEVILHLLSFCAVDDLCRLSKTCTGWYCFIHASEAFKQAHDLLSPKYLSFHRSWKETAVRRFLLSVGVNASGSSAKRIRVEGERALAETGVITYHPVTVKRRFFNDHLFQAWMCTILPCHYHLRLPAANSTLGVVAEKGAAWPRIDGAVEQQAPCYRSAFKEVPRCSGLSQSEFRTRFEEPNLPIILTDVATSWPIFRILQGNFKNLTERSTLLFRPGVDNDVPIRCEHTMMSVTDYVRYAIEQMDERPIYMFDADFATSMTVESLYSVPAHFGCDDFFKVLGDARPKYRWIIAGPTRGGSSFHVDPNYTSAWNANLTGRKRWIFLPPGCTPAGVFPSEDMSEVATPVSLTEWLLNHYDATVEKWHDVGFECICEPGDIVFVPCGWWHFVINLENSVAITQNYVSECNLPRVMKFLSVMKSSISGIDEDADCDDADKCRMVEGRRVSFISEFATAMHARYPELMQRVEADLEREAEERRKKKESVALPLLDPLSEGFSFNF